MIETLTNFQVAARQLCRGAFSYNSGSTNFVPRDKDFLYFIKQMTSENIPAHCRKQLQYSVETAFKKKTISYEVIFNLKD